jgi:hypothetical protein
MLPSACDTVADIVQNAFESGADNVWLDFVRADSSLSVAVRDDGCGMDAPTLAKVRDPFFTSPGKHPSRRVGLGIPFLQQAADLCGGSLDIDSAPGKGTRVAFRFDSSHIDAPPVGDVPALFSQLMAFPDAPISTSAAKSTAAPTPSPATNSPTPSATSNPRAPSPCSTTFSPPTRPI